MVLDRDLSFTEAELQFPAGAPRISVDAGGGPVSQRDRDGGIPRLGRRYP
jgi:hypothetical protein